MGVGAVIGKVIAADVPPPGVGLNTVTEALPAALISLAEIAAVSCVLLANVVVRSAPFQRTFELEMNEEPFAVSVKSGSPALALVGEMEVKTGTGFWFWGGGGEVPPPPPQLPTRRASSAVKAETTAVR
jgi:hypothetical protein